MDINFLLGFSRSGTSIFMSYLRSHPEIETGFEEPNHLWRIMTHKNWKKQYEKDFNINEKFLQRISDKATRKFVQSFYGDLCRKTGKSSVILKHPWLVPHVHNLERCFPTAKFIFIRRHPYDVIASVLDFADTDKIANSMFGEKLRPIIDLYVSHVAYLEEAKNRYPEKILSVKFEGFIKTPERVLADCFKFCGLSTPNMKQVLKKGPVRTARVLDKTKLSKPHNKFSWLSLPVQKAIVRNLRQHAMNLGYDPRLEVLTQNKKA